MGKFEESYNLLNERQIKAVDQVDGPMLVIAGPGTGKTQLLSTRVANILSKTDVQPSNILCLTFTESGVQNMRDRLRGMAGDAAYDITISTYHSFGSDIIKSYNEHFQEISTERTDDVRMERPIDELAQIQIIEKIIDDLPFDSPLLSSRYYVKNVVNTIGDLKQNLISPQELRTIAQKNIEQIGEVQPFLNILVNDKGGFSRKKNEAFSQYEELDKKLEKFKSGLGKQASLELNESRQQAEEENSTKPLTAWKNKWLHKNENDEFTLTDISKSLKSLALADIYEEYNKQLHKQAAYDFNDMILRATRGIKINDELRFNLQERYQYILLDEFQDTNPSQFELIKRLTDHPIHEGRPNVMAVGDDDQAIFAFQGAHVGNLQDFIDTYKDVTVINLVDNYRSHKDILEFAHNISLQIENRPNLILDKTNNSLLAKNNKIPKNSKIVRREFNAEANEYSWVASKIGNLIKNGVQASEIAVIAPKHKILENTVPFLKRLKIPLSYEKRENILETEIIQNIHLIAKLISALTNNDTATINQYFPVVLGLSFWGIKTDEIWKTNWHFASKTNKKMWPEIALNNKSLKDAASFMLKLGSDSSIDPLEIILDKIIGTKPVIVEKKEVYSPLKDFYFKESQQVEAPLKYYESITHLSVIRSNLRDHQASSDKQLTISDFINFFAMYESAEEALINSHPIAQGENSVQLLTAYKAKGLEFEHVFILQALDDVWGAKSRGGSNKLPLPENLSHIRYLSSSDDERLRLLYVAITRAKYGLYISSHTTKDNGKPTSSLKYLSENNGISPYLPEKMRNIEKDSTRPETLAENTEILWRAGYEELPANFKNLLAERLKSYRLSPTHLNSFIDVEYGGPQAFLSQTILRFPQAPSASGEFGTAIHNTLEWLQNQTNKSTKPTTSSVLDHFDKELDYRYMTTKDRDHARKKGRNALDVYLKKRSEMFKKQAKAEVNFFNENVTIGEAHLSGKIDRIEINEDSKTIDIVDYKTGAPVTKWQGSTKAYKYKQQLYIYKLLIENSVSYKNYRVRSARLEFIEPLNISTNTLAQPLYLDLNKSEEDNINKLIKIIWQHIFNLDLPDISKYSQDLKGILAFEKDLLEKNI